ncbi:MAG: MFS transporter [Firmicutes bacterium]|nr:MFS transporter [Bacillota bacterium]
MIRRFKGSYLSYVLVFFFFFFCMAAFSSVLSVYLTGIGIGVANMARIVSASGIFALFMIPITGYMSDRTRKPRLIGGIMLICVGIFAMLFSQSRTVALLFILNGLTMSFISAVQPILERLAGASKYRYGILRVWGTIGYAVGAQVAGLIIGTMPSVVLFITILIGGLLCALGFAGAEDPIMDKRKSTEEEPQEKKPAEKIKLSSFLKNPNYLLFLLITVLFWGASGVNMTYVPILLRDLGIETSLIGTVIFLSTLVEIPLILFSNKFMDRFSGKSLIFLACGLTLFEFLVYGLVSVSWVVVTVVILLKAEATTTYVMIVLKIVSNLVAPELRTTGLSLVNTSNSIGGIIMQNIAGMMVESLGLSRFYLVLAGMITLSIILASFLKVKNDLKVFE